MACGQRVDAAHAGDHVVGERYGAAFDDLVEDGDRAVVNGGITPDEEAAAGVVGEAMMTMVLTEALLEKFGGDSIEETLRNYRSYVQL